MREGPFPILGLTRCDPQVHKQKGAIGLLFTIRTVRLRLPQGVPARNTLGVPCQGGSSAAPCENPGWETPLGR